MLYNEKDVLMMCNHAYVLHWMASLNVDKISWQLCRSLFVPIN